MRIAIIGTGRVGAALGRRFASAGFDVIYGSRSSNEDKIDLGTAMGAPVLEPDAASARADIVVLAVPWSAARSSVSRLGDLSGKILIDATNPVAMGETSVESPGSLGFGSGAEAIAAWASGAHVVKAFNTTGSANLADPTIGGATIPVLVCGEDGPAQVVVDLARAAGFEPIVLGGLDRAVLAESAALLWITLAYQQGMGPDFAFVVARR